MYEAAALRLADANPEALPDVVAALLAMNAFDANGGLTMENVQYSLDYYVHAGELEPGLTAADAADLSYLEDVLQEIGRR